MREDLFTVVMEQFPTDTVDYADIVLPATMQTEHLDVNDGYGHMYVHLNRPAVEPPGECLLHDRDVPPAGPGDGPRRSPRCTTTTRTLARTLLGDPTSRLRRALRSEGWMRLTYPSRSSPFTDGFPTPSGKLEFFSETRGSATATTRSPATRRPPRPPARRGHPLALIAPASHWFLNSIFANKPDLLQKAGGPRVDAAPGRRGEPRARDRRRARACSTRAASSRPRSRSPTASARAWSRPPRATGSSTSRGGANVNATVDERDADMGGGAVFHDCSVWVRAA